MPARNMKIAVASLNPVKVAAVKAAFGTQFPAAELELGEANDRVFATLNSKQGGGAFGLLTDGLYTRESIYTQTLVLALIPFVHELWF